MNINAFAKVLVGPFLYENDCLIPSIVIIDESRFQKIIRFPSLTVSEEEFVRAISTDRTPFEELDRLFTPVATAWQRDRSLDLPPDSLPQDTRDQAQAILSALPVDATMVLTVPGRLLLPGLIDIHTHFRTPGQEWKEDFTTGSRAALKGGITTIFDMPNNLQPIITQERLDEKKALARKAMQVNYGFYYGITDENVATAHQITGNCGYKVFLGSSTGNLLISNWKRTLPICYTLDKPVIIHAEDEAQIQANTKRLGTISVRDHPFIRNPRVAEAAVLNIKTTLTSLAAPARSPVIIAHISTQRELDIIRRLQEQHFPVLSEVTLHHLFLNLRDFEQAPSLLKANPPIRSAEESLSMQQALQQNAITFVSSDHAPHTLEEKQSQSPPSGVPGMEYSLLLLFDAFANGKLSLQTMLNTCAGNACKHFMLNEMGRIATGYLADCTLLNPLENTTIDNHDVQSKAGFSPFHGRTVHGQVEGTIVNGQIGFWQGEFFPTQPRDLFPK